MIPSSLRRTVLVLAVISLTAVRAAAQTRSDGGFESAVREAPQLTLRPEVRALAQKPVVAKPKAPAAAADVWDKVVELVKKDGKYRPEAGMMPGMFSIEESTGDPKAEHTMRGITFLGMLNEEEKFEALGAMLVIKQYKLDPKDGNWRIDQWMFETDVYGEVMDGGHVTVVQTPAGKTLSAVPEKLNPADPKIQAQYDSMLKHWAERKGA